MGTYEWTTRSHKYGAQTSGLHRGQRDEYIFP